MLACSGARAALDARQPLSFQIGVSREQRMDGIKRDAPGTPLVRLSTAGNESWGPVAGKDWMLQRVVYCCRGLSGTVCPIGGRDDGRAA